MAGAQNKSNEMLPTLFLRIEKEGTYRQVSLTD